MGSTENVAYMQQHIQVGVLSTGHNQIQIKSNLHPSKVHAGYLNQKDKYLN